MLANNNRQMLRRLAFSGLKSDGRRTIVLFVAIVLATVLLIGVFTTGISYLRLSRLQDTRLYGGERDITIANGFTPEQLALLENDARVESVGQQVYAGVVQHTEADETASVGLIWDDVVLWEQQRADVITAQEGHYPQAENEIMTSREALAACGLAGLGVGDRFTATVETNAGVKTEQFVISGIWEGYGDTAPFFVSRAFLDRSGYVLADSGILSVKLAQDFVLPQTLEGLREGLALSTEQIYQTSTYIDNSWKVLLGVIGLALVIALSAGLLIYNIFYLSAARKRRYYGLLQTLGMTERQVAQLVRRQMLGITLVAMVVGTALGVGTTLELVPQLLNALGITADLIQTQLHPLILLASLGIVLAAVLAGLRTPLRMARQGTLVEAMRAQRPQPVMLAQGGRLEWRMARAELSRDHKKTAVVLASLALSLSVFVCLSTIISSQDERTAYPLYWDADLLIRNDSETSEDIASYRPILEGLADEIAAVPGVADVHEVVSVPFVLADDDFAVAWLGAYSESRPYLETSEVMGQFRANPSRYYGMLRAVDAEEFDHLNAQLAEPVDRDAFLAGEIALAAAGGITMPEAYLDSAPLSLAAGGETLSVRVAAEVYDNGDLGASRNIGPNLIVSQHWLESLSAVPITTSLTVHYDSPEDAATEQRVMDLLAARAQADNGDVFWQSHLDEVQAIRAAAGDLNGTGVAIALLLLIVGMLNYVNTMAASVQSRRLSFSIMESLGMTPGQIRRQLLCEGLLIVLGVLALTATLGLAVTVIAFQAINHAGVAFTLPLAPILAAAVLVVLLCSIVPLACYNQLADKGALIERLRMSE